MSLFTLQSLFDLNFNPDPEFIVFTDFINNRLTYTLDFLIKRKWRKNYILTQDIQTFLNSDKIKINYSTRHFDNTINIFPKKLIQSKGIENNYLPDFSTHSPYHYTIDILEYIFFCISRYEEWQNLHIQYDQHGRFEASQSKFKHFLPHPYLDKVINDFENYILQYYPSTQFSHYYKEIYTFDLDNILAFKGKYLYRTIGGIMKSLLRAELKLIKERINTLYFQKDDPFKEVYDFIQSVSQQHPVIFFILCRSDTSFDRAAEIKHPHTIQILNYLKKFAIIGLHPSYYSSEKEYLIEKEKHILEEILQQKVIASRQHYLRINIRTTPKQLLQQGIYYDFTMGFASQAGFRAGTSYPFYYYDFEKESPANLLFIPFSVMDGAYFNYQNISIEKALQEINTIKSEIQKYGGYFIPLFHEITLSPLFQKDTQGWKKLFSASSF